MSNMARSNGETVPVHPLGFSICANLLTLHMHLQVLLSRVCVNYHEDLYIQWIMLINICLVDRKAAFLRCH